MRIATWNCRIGGFRRKAARIAPRRPDVLVVPECERVALTDFSEAWRPTSGLWFGGANEKRGLGVFSFTGAELEPVDLAGEPLGFFIPLRVSAGDVECQVAAVWTTPSTVKARTYRQVHEGLERHADWVRAADTVVLGDFNNNATYAQGKPWAELMALAEPLGLRSAYHAHFHDAFGAEKQPTYFHRGKAESGWHVDYCFVPQAWIPKITSVEVGNHADWCDVSDHVPLVVDVGLPV